ncbi:MAG: hypothetical protein JRJ87_13080 [Deltaproteobacteria bacterium]|nr:hypothetical protein [Deltaproteobacteria bacterium]
MSSSLDNSEERIEIIQQTFSIMMKTFGFRLLLADSSVVRFESADSYISITHDKPDVYLEITFGPVRAVGQSSDSFDSLDLAELAKPAGQTPWTNEPIENLIDFMKRLISFSRFLQTKAIGVLRGDRETFDFLVLARKVRRRRHGQEVSGKLIEKGSQCDVVVRKGTTAKQSISDSDE